jgi:hypothetical protein
MNCLTGGALPLCRPWSIKGAGRRLRPPHLPVTCPRSLHPRICTMAKYLITGVAGFIGSNLAHALIGEKAAGLQPARVCGLFQRN